MLQFIISPPSLVGNLIISRFFCCLEKCCRQNFDTFRACMRVLSWEGFLEVVLFRVFSCIVSWLCLSPESIQAPSASLCTVLNHISLKVWGCPFPGLSLGIQIMIHLFLCPQDRTQIVVKIKFELNLKLEYYYSTFPF